MWSAAGRRVAAASRWQRWTGTSSSSPLPASTVTWLLRQWRRSKGSLAGTCIPTLLKSGLDGRRSWLG
ncbi:hypothetical protein EI555_014061 [Monodon monoceros]|uniref:Uncharacterized protein n=1 Tax=Monodon monoceros TaxID=40151 RepID=A0A4U1FEL3_MONMO|nr:hypothetical protein EI555_014061 [Monodon monoceros]